MNFYADFPFENVVFFCMEVEEIVEKRNLTSDDAINRQLWRLKTISRRTTVKW